MFKINDRVRIKPSTYSQYLYSALSVKCDDVYTIHTMYSTYDNMENILDRYYTLYQSPINQGWREDQLEHEKSNTFATVNSIKTKSRNVRVGDSLHCSCKYKVTKLHPVWDLNGNDIEDHPNNKFYTKRLLSCICPIHNHRVK